jgi:GntR family transcriptional regulator / MocR family aminotransferase
MFPYKTIIQIEKDIDMPVYLQIANSFAREIRNGILKPGTRLPGARSLAALIQVNRNTVAAVYDELSLQGYVELLSRKGAFVSKRIPDIRPKPITGTSRSISYPAKSGFSIQENRIFPDTQILNKNVLEFDDGLPDKRIAPFEELTRAYRGLLKRGSRVPFGYTDPAGNKMLREELSSHLNETRGLQTCSKNVFITRGSQMGIFLLSQILLRTGDRVIVGETNYHAADLAFLNAGGTLHRVRVDDRGIDVDEIEKICLKIKIRAVYVTPHHHFPTTVTLSACRRMKLLSLAEKYRFAILEDEYDYDFHYKSSPILPLAATDNKGMVISIGSLSKNFSPALRVGYLAGPENVMVEVAKLRSIIDRQGDYLLEQALAELFKEGVIKRHLRKALILYKERRDNFCTLLANKLNEDVSFTQPEGGLAVWAMFNKKKPLQLIAQQARQKGLTINDGEMYQGDKINLNATRLGFASLDFREQEKAVTILQQVVKKT